MPLVCEACQRQFKKIQVEHACLICGRAGDFVSSGCSDCQKWSRTSTSWFQNRSLYVYNEGLQTYMQKYKFQGDYRLRKIFQKEFRKVALNAHRLIVPIPLHPDTYQQRGFNQVKGLLGDLKSYDVLKTKERTKKVSQSEKNRRQRLQFQQPFKVDSHLLPLIKNQDVLIVDDIYTTGRTIRWAAFLLKQTGAKSVRGLTLAH